MTALVVMAKSPVAGRVKTRLCPPCTPEEAAAVAEAALADTLEAVAGCSAARKVVALAGEAGPWLPPGFVVIPQRGGKFAARLANAWSDAGGPGVLIGMDTPQVTAEEYDGLLALMERRGRPAVLAPAADGGWWAIGLPRCDPRPVFAGIEMSTSRTGWQQERRLRRLGFDVVVAHERRDIDTFDDLVAVAGEAPGTRTAGQARCLTAPPGAGPDAAATAGRHPTPAASQGSHAAGDALVVGNVVSGHQLLYKRRSHAAGDALVVENVVSGHQVLYKRRSQAAGDPLVVGNVVSGHQLLDNQPHLAAAVAAG